VTLRIAFFGLPLAALLLREDGHTIVHAAICRKDAIGTRRLVRALGASKVDIKPNVDTQVFERKLRKAKPDLVVSWFWTTRLPMRLVETAPLGGFGVHPSLLPRHRGPDPYFWAIDAGDTVTGVTAHRLAAEYDTGAILGQRMLRIDPSWTAWTLAKKLDRPSLALLREIASAFARGAPPPDIAQDHARATDAPAPDDELLEIDWAQSSERIERRVLAASPYPGAFTFLGDEPITLTRVAPARAFPKALTPGEAAIVGDGDGARAVIRTGDGALELLEGRGGEEGDYDLDREAFCELVDALKSAALPSER
jgi:methionyl-tRNA formyltransferase